MALTVPGFIARLTTPDADIDALLKELEAAQEENKDFGQAFAQQIHDYFKALPPAENEQKEFLQNLLNHKNNINTVAKHFRSLWLKADEENNEEKELFYRGLFNITSTLVSAIGGLSQKLNPPPLTDKSLDDLFKNIALKGGMYTKEVVVKEILSRMDKTAPDVNLEYGPLNKSIYTYQLEELLQDILAGKKMDYQKSNNEDVITLSEENKTYNLTKILKNCDWSHLQLDEKMAKAYVRFLQGTPQFKPKILNELDQNIFPTEEDFKKRDTKGAHENLSYAEKLAVNIYTSAAYSKMNGLLRNKMQHGSERLAELQENLLHSAFCAMALNKIPIQRYEYAIRGEKALPKEILNQRIACVEKGEYTFERGFLSTSGEGIELGFAGEVRILITGGILGQDISALSLLKENEVLAIPSQIAWKGYTQDKEGNYYFHAQAIRTLSGLSVEYQEAHPAPEPEQKKSGGRKQVLTAYNLTGTASPIVTQIKGVPAIAADKTDKKKISPNS